MTSTVSVVSPSGRAGQDVELPGEIFDAPVNIPLIHQVVVAQEAAARQGTHATKTRGAVRGGGKKPYRQKGTGRARQGSIRAPQYAGGGTVHGPQPRSYVQRTPKKMKAAALRGALSDRAASGRVAVVSEFVEGEAPSTSAALAVLRTATGLAEAKLTAKVLVVAQADDVADLEEPAQRDGRPAARRRPAQHVRRPRRRARGVHPRRAGHVRRPGREEGGRAVSATRIPNPRDILLRPVISEKTYRLADDGKYTFLVPTDANRTQVRQAVETVFGVKVTGVNTLNRPGKRRRTRYGWGQRSATKRAIVSLAEGERIDVFGGPVS